MKLRWIAALTLLHAAIAVAAISPLFFYLNVGTAQRVFGGSNGESALLEDVRAYHDYASRIVEGQIPYRDFAIEYPIGAIPFFVLPRLVASSFEVYRWIFAAEMMIVDGLIIAMIAAVEQDRKARRGALVWYTIGLASLGALPIARFDLVPTALALAAATRWKRGQTVIAGFLAGLGGLVKLFPAVVLWPGLVDSGPRRTRGFAAMLLTIGLGAVVWFAIGGTGVWRALAYHSGRGLEIGSVYASVLIVVGKVAGWPLSHDFNHSSVELIAPMADSLARVSLAVQILWQALVLGSFFMSRRDSLIRYGGASILAFALFGKVLSPQYMLWILPFVALEGGRRGRIARPLVVLCGGLSSLVYFWAGVGLLSFHPVAVAILVARNLGLVVLLSVMIAEPGRDSRDRPGVS